MIGGKRRRDVLTAAEEGMFTSTRKICFVLCGGRRGTAIPRGPGGASRRAIAPAIGGRQVPLAAEGREGLDLMSDNDAKCTAEETLDGWDG